MGNLEEELPPLFTTCILYVLERNEIEIEEPKKHLEKLFHLIVKNIDMDKFNRRMRFYQEIISGELTLQALFYKEKFDKAVGSTLEHKQKEKELER